MRILAIDASARRRAVAVLADEHGALLEEWRGTGDGSAEALVAAIGPLLSGGVDAVVVAIGPGSHSGVRAAMAIAVGVAQAASLPVRGVGSLEVVAHAAPRAASQVRAVADAGRGAAYIADYRREGGVLRSESEPVRVELAAVATPDRLAVSLDELDLDGVAAHPERTGAALAAAAAAALTAAPLDIRRLTQRFVGWDVTSASPVARPRRAYDGRGW
jgi:tRNA threonylcarbamoyladenosine biosynthesis protein TsaB